MLLSIQFPIADSRRFLDGTGLLSTPRWPLPQADEEYLRFFGAIKRRKGGGLNGWVGENEICEARRALRFSTTLKSTASQLGIRSPLRCAFRRFYFDGVAVGKYEVGITSRRHKHATLDLPEPITQHLLTTFLDLPILVRKASGPPAQLKLIQVGNSIAQLYAAASTSLQNHFDWPEWSVSAGNPLLFLEFQMGEEIAIPYKLKTVNLPKDWQGLQLSQCFVPHGGKEFPMWVLSISPKFDQEKARTLRLYLLRLHAEHQCLWLILRDIGDSKISPVRGTPTSDRLQRYLDGALTRIGKLETKSVTQYSPDVADVARTSVDAMSPGHSYFLIERIRSLDFRLSVQRGVITFINANIGELTVGDKITTGNITGSILNIKSHLDNATQQIGALPNADQATKDELAQLTKQLNDLLAQVPKVAPEKTDQAETVAKRVETLVEEASKPNPDKEVVGFSLDSLKKAAANIGAVLPDVLPIAAKIASFIVKLVI